ncbi:nucleoid-associated protein [uncultured Chryseobacterium sp.]|uniref:nucleoid-associated protein n=1 Tax=uncultured Chryseobacterium sp. TaxID=259322 RepID=UPI00258E98B4|nr:nucleoid-associated protein [uncultured Chryseobacterium sp.]
MAEIKQKGSDILINNIVIHQINKESGKDFVSLKIAEKLLPISKKEIYFIADIKKSFTNLGQIYGVFEEQNSSTIFENQLDRYIANEIDFLEFTKELMLYYNRILQSKIMSSGGFLVYSEYLNTNNNHKYLLVLAINNKQTYLFNEDLTLSEVKSIDLSKIDVASQINLTKWSQHKQQNDNNIDTYLSFKGGLKNVSDYFQSFIGCANRTTKTAGSKKLVTAIKEYLNNKNLPKEDKDRILDEVYFYCLDQDKKNKGVLLNEISKIVDEDNPENFEHFAGDEKYSVNPIISIDRNVIKILTKTKYKSEDFLIEFDNILLGNKIKYNKEDNSLLIEDIPIELSQQIIKNS